MLLLWVWAGFILVESHFKMLDANENKQKKQVMNESRYFLFVCWFLGDEWMYLEYNVQKILQ